MHTEGKGAASTNSLGFNEYCTITFFDDLFGDHETKAYALAIHSSGALELTKAIEQFGYILFFDPDTCINHFYIQALLFFQVACKDGNFPLIGEFERIFDQVYQHLHQAAPVSN